MRRDQRSALLLAIIPIAIFLAVNSDNIGDEDLPVVLALVAVGVGMFALGLRALLKERRRK
jgi:hypothetical protein